VPYIFWQYNIKKKLSSQGFETTLLLSFLSEKKKRKRRKKIILYKPSEYRKKKPNHFLWMEAGRRTKTLHHTFP